MRILLITDGKVSGEISGAMLAEVLANNPGIEAIEDTFGLGRVIGMSYTNGALSGEPAPEPVASPQTPQQVTMRQARLALLGAGLLSGIDAAINSLSEPDKSAAKIEWEYAAVVQRSSGLVPAMGTALGMTEAQIDDLFITASAL